MLKHLGLLIPTILLFGVSAFFRKMAVDRIHPYQMQIVAGAVYALEIPVFLYLINRNGIVGYSSLGVLFAVISLLMNVFAAVMFGTLLKGSSDPGMLSTMVSTSPVVTTALTVIFLGEQLTVRKVVATAVMLFGFFLFNVK